MVIKIWFIHEEKKVLQYLIKRKILVQYQKSKSLVLQWLFGSIDLKLRKPKQAWIRTFRINKKYRALCLIENGTMTVFDVDDHQ